MSRLRAALLVVFGLALMGPAPAVRAEDAIEHEVSACLECHGERDFTKVSDGGETVSLTVDRALFKASVHGEALRCTDCHAGMDELPHPERTAKDASKSPRTRISDTCAACHPDVADTYLKSVHGRALSSGSVDVPVCIDCHRVHDISDPRVTSWIVRTPELCAKCHTDGEKMKRYGLSTNVVQSYLSDFHGVTAATSRARGSNGIGEARVTALCIDCHGVHDITTTDAANSPVLRANLAKTCRKCHPSASENFPDAWLSHYEPSWDKAPLVYGVKLFYLILIPFITAGLILQVTLHLWRVVVKR